jgi:hypothetical protein
MFNATAVIAYFQHSDTIRHGHIRTKLSRKDQDIVPFSIPCSSTIMTNVYVERKIVLLIFNVHTFHQGSYAY